MEKADQMRWILGLILSLLSFTVPWLAASSYAWGETTESSCIGISIWPFWPSETKHKFETEFDNGNRVLACPQMVLLGGWGCDSGCRLGCGCFGREVRLVA